MAEPEGGGGFSSEGSGGFSGEGGDSSLEASDSSLTVTDSSSELYSDEAGEELYDPGYDHSEYEAELMDTTFDDFAFEGSESYDPGYDAEEYSSELLDTSYDSSAEEVTTGDGMETTTENVEPTVEESTENTEETVYAEEPEFTEEAEKIDGKEANSLFFDQNTDGSYEPPFDESKPATVGELTEDTTLVRAYTGEDPSGGNKIGAWLTPASEIEGLSPEQVQDKLALPQTPKYVCDVTVPKGTTVIYGTTAEQPEWGGKGGGKQVYVVGRIDGSCYKNGRAL